MNSRSAYASKNKSSRYVKPKLTEPKGKMDKFIIGEFNNPLSVIDRRSGQKLLENIDFTSVTTNLTQHLLNARFNNYRIHILFK